MRTHAHWCNAIADDGTAADCNCSVGKMVERPDLTTLEREVVRAAEAWRHTYAKYSGDIRYFELAYRERVDLREAVEALLVARKPKGVKPSEVEPGTRFRFAGDPGEVGTVVRLPGESRWLTENGFVYGFRDDALIIPLNPQEPV